MLETTGWEKQSHDFDNKAFESLIGFKEQLLSTVSDAVGILPHVFNINDIERTELAKAICRAFLRYDQRSILLIKSIAAKMQEQGYKYCTLPYPIIHLPNDTSEPGPLHTDGQNYIDQFLTVWVPLNDCFHKPLLIKNYSGAYVYPEIKAGEFLMWTGSMAHEGVINKSDHTHIAMVSKFTSSPVLNERTLEIEELLSMEDQVVIYPIDSYFPLIQKMISFYEEIKLPNDESALDFFKSIVVPFDEYERKRISFMLTLLAQRLERYKGISVLYLYVYSIAIYQDNLLGLQKVIDRIYNFRGIEPANEFANYFLEKYPSQQALFAINTAIHIPLIYTKQELELLKWEA